MPVFIGAARVALSTVATLERVDAEMLNHSMCPQVFFPFIRFFTLFALEWPVSTKSVKSEKQEIESRVLLFNSRVAGYDVGAHHSLKRECFRAFWTTYRLVFHMDKHMLPQVLHRTE